MAWALRLRAVLRRMIRTTPRRMTKPTRVTPSIIPASAACDRADPDEEEVVSDVGNDAEEVVVSEKADEEGKEEEAVAVLEAEARAFNSDGAGAEKVSLLGVEQFLLEFRLAWQQAHSSVVELYTMSVDEKVAEINDNQQVATFWDPIQRQRTTVTCT